MRDTPLESLQPHCIQCGVEMPGGFLTKKFCSTRCKARWWNANPHPEPVTSHKCRVCGTEFPITKKQHNKWLCSDDCRRASNAKSVRTFQSRRPQMIAIYRARTRERMAPDSQHRRFYSWNPDAPHACESCGETRVLEIAHKPGHERMGKRRCQDNMQWPSQVWVLCPTCHRLLDRMNYSPQELRLGVWA